MQHGPQRVFHFICDSSSHLHEFALIWRLSLLSLPAERGRQVSGVRGVGTFRGGGGTFAEIGIGGTYPGNEGASGIDQSCINGWAGRGGAPPQIKRGLMCRRQAYLETCKAQGPKCIP